MNAAPPGIYTASITPFSQDGAVDEGALRAHLDYLASAKVGVFLPLVGTGEAQLMREKEIRRVWEIGVEQLKGKVPVYACGIGPFDTAYTIELANEAGATGVDGIYLYPPRPLPSPVPQGRPEVEGYFKELLEGVKYPVHLANNPFIIGYSVPVDIFADCVNHHDQVIGICDADFSLSYSQRLIEAVGSKASVLEVITPNLLGSLAVGGDGALSIEANVAPRLCTTLFDAFRSGDAARAAELFQKLLKLQAGTGKFQNPTGIKAALNILGLPGRYPRRPYLTPDQAGQEEIKRLLDELEIREIEGIR